MKILVYLLFSFSLMAQVQKPAKMYDHKNILTNYFRPLREYVVKLKQLYPYDTRENDLIFYTTNNQYSQFSISLVQIDETKIEIQFFSKNRKLDIIEINSTDSIKINLTEILDLSFVNKLTEKDYTVLVNSRSAGVISEVSNNTRITQYILGNSGATAYLEEINQNNFYESIFYFRCAECGGEILRAQFSSETEQYFRGLDSRQVNDTDFFNRANRFYIRAVLRGISQLINNRSESKIWPEVQ